jgi:primosomal protein N' (replication factor Y)
MSLDGTLVIRLDPPVLNPRERVLRIEVAVPTPIYGTFTYLSDQLVEAGVRVQVPFGARSLVGVSLGPVAEDAKLDPAIELRSLEKVVDDSPIYSPSLVKLARWLSEYYLHPLGEVFRTMLPASAEKLKKSHLEITPKGQAAILSSGANQAEAECLQKIFKKRSQLSRSTALKNLRLQLGSPEAATMQLAFWRRRGWVTAKKATAIRARAIDDSSLPINETSPAVSIEHSVHLNPTQADVVASVWRGGIEQNSTDRKPFLLWGVTGSGKTEVYLHIIEKMLNSDPNAQTLVLVPEISLTPQMTRVFEARFGQAVAVVHSAMTDADRWHQMQRIRTAEARVLIGPRSAVFAPFQQLKLLIVDEEHDSSYKQATGLAYHARDVAIVRAKMDGATVVLGSATPSMESYYNATTGKYHLLRMPNRATGSPLPTVGLLPSERGSRIGAVVAQNGRALELGEEQDELSIHPDVIAALQKTVRDGHQSMVLVNRRGYSLYLFSLEKRQPISCPNCSISLTTHNRTRLLRCHYCDYSVELRQVLAEHPGETLVAMGSGSQKIEDALHRMIPGLRISRIDSDTMSNRDRLPAILAAFRDRKIDLLVGTQMLAKGHDFPRVTTIAILEVDQMLSLPDFRAGERTFQLIVQAAGRAGRAHLPGQVLVQALKSDHPVIQLALAQDFEAFSARELKFRSIHSYPPFSRMIHIEWNSTSRELIQQWAGKIEGWIGKFEQLYPDAARQVNIFGPTSPPLEFVRGRHRRTVLLSSTDGTAVRRVAKAMIIAFDKLEADLRMKIDVDPQTIL